MSTIWIVAIGFVLMGVVFFIYCLLHCGDDTQRSERQEYVPREFNLAEREKEWKR